MILLCVLFSNSIEFKVYHYHLRCENVSRVFIRSHTHTHMNFVSIYFVLQKGSDKNIFDWSTQKCWITFELDNIFKGFCYHTNTMRLHCANGDRATSMKYSTGFSTRFENVCTVHVPTTAMTTATTSTTLFTLHWMSIAK